MRKERVLKRYTIIIWVAVSILTLLLLFIIAANRIVIHEARLSSLYECGSENKINDKYDAIVVLGAGLQRDGSPSHITYYYYKTIICKVNRFMHIFYII